MACTHVARLERTGVSQGSCVPAGGTKKIKAAAEQLPAFQAPGAQQLRRGTQQLAKGAQRAQRQGAQQLGKGTQRLKLGVPGLGGLPLPGTGTKPIGAAQRRPGRKDPNTVRNAQLTHPQQCPTGVMLY